jgi:hypothetical protein
MAKKKPHNRANTSQDKQVTDQGWKRLVALAAIVLMLTAAASIFFYSRFYSHGNKNNSSANQKPILTTSLGPASGSTNLAQAAAGTNTMEMGVTGEPLKMNVAQAVMVTEEFDFGARTPSIAEAIRQIERGYQPDDGVGRTFAILDAYGEPTPDGKLRVSMHVSSEKPGMAMLKFKPTGKLFWRARIGKPGDPPAGGKNLVIYLANGAGGNYVLDGGRGGSNVLEVFLQNSQQRARDVWPDGAEREVTFIYSACGCPVKVMVKRVGDRTVRTKDTPVIFPDDPGAVATISNLMKW